MGLRLRGLPAITARSNKPTAALPHQSEKARWPEVTFRDKPPLQAVGTLFSHPLTRVGEQSWRGCAPSTQLHSTGEDVHPWDTTGLLPISLYPSRGT